MQRSISPRIKLADLVASDIFLLSVVHRLGIPFGFGDDTVSEVCRRHGISPALFQVLSKTYSDAGYDPAGDLKGLGRDDLPVIVGFLKASHAHYVNACFPTLHSDIHKMLEGCDKATADIMNRFFDDYEKEELNHFRYEEQTVFPCVAALLEGSVKLEGYEGVAGQFEENHHNIGSHLNDLKNLLVKYISTPQPSDVQMRVLEQIYSIEADTKRHAAIEEKVLLPLVMKLL